MNLAFYLLLAAQEPEYLENLDEIPEPPAIEEIYEEAEPEEIG